MKRMLTYTTQRALALYVAGFAVALSTVILASVTESR